MKRMFGFSAAKENAHVQNKITKVTADFMTQIKATKGPKNKSQIVGGVCCRSGLLRWWLNR